MSHTVKSLKVTYNPINEENTFTSGDVVSGHVTLEMAKDCQISSLLIKFKGKAQVLWTERYGQTTVVYHAKDKYFSIKQYIIHDKDHTGDNQTLLANQNGETWSNVVSPGCHVYPFTFQIPFQVMPSSFDSSIGKIVYLLEAKLSRSMRVPQKDSTKINFVTKEDLRSSPELMMPQHDSKDKKMKFFNSGTVAMDVKLEKTGFFQGEGLKVLAFIENNLSRQIRPKYCVYKKHSFFARGKRKVWTLDLFKEVYLDVKYASDPEIKFPIVILPASQVPAGVAPPPAASGFGFEPFGIPNPPAWGLVPPQPPAGAPHPSDPPPAYGAYAMDPPLTDFGKKY
ncbi:arrestin domain-containing protein 3-like isoform X4 [Etheostoma cragini]|uniref:arrestin domain-containing protein 3-like isoform X4 n=1 Tax=Etheostoma cragini TaxID=417921 RepID=UPI00155E21B1|nr:arrestin domain-containing protein 3-like isoform X4 [Etheostoma cragini]